MLEKILRSFEDIFAIGLTGQMHGIAYVDQHGKAVSPLYTWQDGCGNLPDFDGKSICDILAQDYGISASTGYGMVTYLYHSRKGLVPRGASSFCTISDYLGMEQPLPWYTSARLPGWDCLTTKAWIFLGKSWHEMGPILSLSPMSL